MQFFTSGKRTWTDSFPPADVATVPVMFNSKTIKEHTMLIVPSGTDLRKAADEIKAKNPEEQKTKLLKIGAAATASSRNEEMIGALIRIDYTRVDQL